MLIMIAPVALFAASTRSTRLQLLVQKPTETTSLLGQAPVQNRADRLKTCCIENRELRIVCGTLCGTVCCVSFLGLMVWCYGVSKPVFSTPF